MTDDRSNASLANRAQPMPTYDPRMPNITDHVARDINARLHGRAVIRSRVKTDLEERDEIGIKKYGTPLQPFNGRNPLIDMYQEGMDMAKYACQTMYEAGLSLRYEWDVRDGEPWIMRNYTNLLDFLIDIRAELYKTYGE